MRRLGPFIDRERDRALLSPSQLTGVNLGHPIALLAAKSVREIKSLTLNTLWNELQLFIAELVT
jgi:hypothetical protein